MKHKLHEHKFWKIMSLADFVLIIILLALAGFSVYFLNKCKTEKQVEIYQANELIYSIPLNEDNEITIGNNAIVQIKNKRVRIVESSCKNKLCVKQGWSNKLPIICVPNKIAIIIRSNKDKMMITK
ncbi:MAG: NusG domain II-containing protein [Candidatus Cloacimonetes bacterium]|nr:NusG domain II-containing protein [Candidatus Cloacimonadota bacterium]